MSIRMSSVGLLVLACITLLPVLAIGHVGEGSISKEGVFEASSTSEEYPNHETNGWVTTILKGKSLHSPKLQWLWMDADFCVGGTSGAVNHSHDHKAKPPYLRVLYPAKGKVTVFLARKQRPSVIGPDSKNTTTVWERDPDAELGWFMAGCHTRDPELAENRADDVEDGEEREESQEAEGAVEEESQALLEFKVTLLGLPNGQIRYTYTVTNLQYFDIDFDWAAVRTSDYPDGWAGTVPADDSLAHSVDANGPPYMVMSDPTPILVSENGWVIGGIGTFAYNSGDELNPPGSCSDLSATEDQTTGAVELTWTNAEAYDHIRVLRIAGDPEAGDLDSHGWRIDEASTSFLDDDPPSGDVTYRVVGVVDDIGSDDSPEVGVELP